MYQEFKKEQAAKKLQSVAELMRRHNYLHRRIRWSETKIAQERIESKKCIDEGYFTIARNKLNIIIKLEGDIHEYRAQLINI